MALIIKEDTLKKHKQAMYFAQDAVVAQQMGDEMEALRNFNNALELELEVLNELKSGDPHVETLGVIVRSAATLAFNCRNTLKALSIISDNKYDFPQNIEHEIDELVMDIESSIHDEEIVNLTDEIVIVDHNVHIR